MLVKNFNIKIKIKFIVETGVRTPSLKMITSFSGTWTSPDTSEFAKPPFSVSPHKVIYSPYFTWIYVSNLFFLEILLYIFKVLLLLILFLLIYAINTSYDNKLAIIITKNSYSNLLQLLLLHTSYPHSTSFALSSLLLIYLLLCHECH